MPLPIIMAIFLAIIFSCREAIALQNPVITLGVGQRPIVVCSGRANIYAVYAGGKNKSLDHHIVFVKSVNAGSTWSAPQELEPVVDDNAQIQIRTVGAFLVVLWSKNIARSLNSNSNSSPKSFCLIKSIDGGRTWTAPINFAPPDSAMLQPQIAFGPDQSMHLVWIASAGNSKQNVFYSYSGDNGLTFSKPVNVSHSQDNCLTPSIIISDQGMVHVSWTDRDESKNHSDIFYRHSLCGFTSASENNLYKISTNIKTAAQILSPAALALGRGGRLFIVWSDNSRDDKAGDVWCVVAKNGKISIPANISATNGISSDVSIGSNMQGPVAVVWSDTSYGNAQTFARVSRDDLENTSYVLELSARGDTAGCKNGNVALSREHVYLIWEQEQMPTSLINIKSLSLKNIGTGACFDITLKSAKSRRVQLPN